MLTLTQSDRMALTQVPALPVLAVIAVRVAYLIALWSFRHRTRKTLATLPAHALDDIGMSPRQATLESRKWFWRP
ncbi:MAG: DUF1127 domain-containing protein [Roseovarius sp.]|nr:DUF1127 domain-containing protein [uncultured Roseovarius sp.]MDX1786213.1 DUF1127 domain-containing protein [Roseovarius sp.]